MYTGFGFSIILSCIYLMVEKMAGLTSVKAAMMNYRWYPRFATRTNYSRFFTVLRWSRENYLYGFYWLSNSIYSSHCNWSNSPVAKKETRTTTSKLDWLENCCNFELCYFHVVYVKLLNYRAVYMCAEFLNVLKCLRFCYISLSLYFWMVKRF